jgi:hypothetical protein
MRLLTLALCATLATGALADTRDARLAAARAYVEMSAADIDIDGMMRAMYRPVLDQLAGQGINPGPNQIDEIHALYTEIMAQPLLDIMRAQDEIMADLLTLEEIEALASFYATPLGRSVMTKLPQMIEAQQPQIMGLLETTMPVLVPRLLQIIEKP